MNEKPDHSHYILLPTPRPGPGARGRSEPAAPAGRGLRALGADPRRQGWAAHPRRLGTYLRACCLLRRDLASLGGGQPGEGGPVWGSASSIRVSGVLGVRSWPPSAAGRRKPRTRRRKRAENSNRQSRGANRFREALTFGQGPIKKGSVTDSPTLLEVGSHHTLPLGRLWPSPLLSWPRFR